MGPAGLIDNRWNRDPFAVGNVIIELLKGG